MAHSGRTVAPSEDAAIRSLREYDMVWCRPYHGDKRINVYRIKDDLVQDMDMLFN